MPKSRITPKQAAEMKRMRAEGALWPDLATAFSMTTSGVRYIVDDDYRARQLDRTRKQAANRKRRNETIRGLHSPDGKPAYRAPAEAAARLAEIPRDTLSLTARIAGDPPPFDPRRHWAPHLNRGGA